MDLCYFDESGFTLESCVPYAWQPIGIPSEKSKRLNVLGFVNYDCQFDSFVFEGSVTSAVVIACIDSMSKKIKKPTTLIIDNASIPTSNEFNENIKKWKKRGLTLYRIPPYSPELNKIEIIWRKIKYEGLPFSAYKSYRSLKKERFKVLSDIGTLHKVNFTLVLPTQYSWADIRYLIECVEKLCEYDTSEDEKMDLTALFRIEKN
jgi:transposase